MHLKQIKSFVKRNGRITQGQMRSLEDNMQRYGLSSSGKYNFVEIFGNNNPVVLDIGFGNGHDLFLQAESNPHINFIGVEVYLAGIGALLKRVHDKHLSNVRVINHDAVEIIKGCIDKDSISRVQLFFPDPWPKKKHHKRRIVQLDFLAKIYTILQNEGILHIATDVEDYALHMQDVFNEFNRFEQSSSTKGLHLKRNTTKFETKGINSGRKIWDLIYLKEQV